MCHVEWEELDWSGFNLNRFSRMKTTLLMSSHKEKRPWTHNNKAECLCMYVYLHVCPCLCFIGGKGTSWATWNPRGNRDWPSRTQGKVATLLCWKWSDESCSCTHLTVSHSTGWCRRSGATRASRASGTRRAWPSGRKPAHTPGIKLSTLPRDKGSFKKPADLPLKLFSDSF